MICQQVHGSDKQAFAMAQPCAAWIADHCAHRKGKKKQVNKYCDWTSEVAEDARNHSFFLDAASDDCVPCVTYWLEQGAEVQKGTEHHPEYHAIAWAEWNHARNVLPLLRDALARELDQTDVDEGQGQSSQGVWHSGQLEGTDLATWVPSEHDREIWCAALVGDWHQVQKWCQIFCSNPMSILLCRLEALPCRLFYWSWLHFIELASLCAKAEEDKNNLIRIKDLVWAREREQVARTMKFVLQIISEDEHAEYRSLIRLLHGDLRFTESANDPVPQKHISNVCEKKHLKRD